jgi:hypothetical protein
MDYLAPDSTEQMIKGMSILHSAINEAAGTEIPENQLLKEERFDKELTVTLKGMVNKGIAHVLKPVQGYRLYRMMFHYYGSRELIRSVDNLIRQDEKEDPLKLIRKRYQEPDHYWVNLGGQLIAKSDVNTLINDVNSGKLSSWSELHKAYDQLWDTYPLQRTNHAIYCLLLLENRSIKDLDVPFLESAANRSVETSRTLLEWTRESRQKDYTNPFRKIPYRNEAEMKAILGDISENSFIRHEQNDVEQYEELVKNILRIVNLTGK